MQIQSNQIFLFKPNTNLSIKSYLIKTSSTFMDYDLIKSFFLNRFGLTTFLESNEITLRFTHGHWLHTEDICWNTCWNILFHKMSLHNLHLVFKILFY